MNTSKLVGTILLTGLCAVAAAAQKTPSKMDSVNSYVTSTVQRTLAAKTQANTKTAELTEKEKKDAEKELTGIRNSWDSNASFKKYPYLLDPAYRRADEKNKQNIRRQYTQPTWARKVGM